MAGDGKGSNGFRLYPGYLDRSDQSRLVDAARACLSAAPLYRPTMPKTGKPVSVRMSNCGHLGWVTDKTGYRYQHDHPVTGRAWPPIPEPLLALWTALADYPAPPEACLINWYDPGARLGLHRDQDEEANDAPVLSVSLGDRALFRIGGATRKDPTRSVLLSSGDVVVLGGASRHFFHGIDRIEPGTSTLLGVPGRINLTLRRVTRPSP